MSAEGGVAGEVGEVDATCACGCPYSGHSVQRGQCVPHGCDAPRPSTGNDALRERITRAIIDHADHMETYTLPALQPRFIDGWSHALRLLRRDAGFIAHGATPPAPTTPTATDDGAHGEGL